MKLKIIQYGGAVNIVYCKSFEFRTNHVTNWIKVFYLTGKSEYIHNVCVIKTESEDKE